jgi:hypothetical protein
MRGAVLWREREWKGCLVEEEEEGGGRRGRGVSRGRKGMTVDWVSSSPCPPACSVGGPSPSVPGCSIHSSLNPSTAQMGV